MILGSLPVEASFAKGFLPVGVKESIGDQAKKSCFGSYREHRGL